LPGALLAGVVTLVVMLAAAGPALAVAGGSLPGNTDPPAISGTSQVGQTIGCSQGTWTGSPTSFAYQWNRDGGGITGAIADSYVIVDADAGKQITCTVTASNVNGSTAATSAAVGATAAPASAPAPAPAPVVSVPALPRAAEVIALPSSKRCASRRRFRIHVKRTAGVTYASAAVFVNGKRVKVVKQARLTAPVDLRGLPKGRFSVKIVVTTVDGRKVSATRRYRACAAKRGGKRKHRL
jgi:hypothetical protein